MNTPAPQPVRRPIDKPASELPRPVRPRTLLQWLLERLCIYPSAD